jgi:hypothetical protein
MMGAEEVAFMTDVPEEVQRSDGEAQGGCSDEHRQG